MSNMRSRLKEARKEKGWSLDELARRSLSSKSYLWELENRDTRRPSAKKVSKVAEALGLTVEYLMKGGDQIQARDQAFISDYLRADEETKLKIRKIFKVVK